VVNIVIDQRPGRPSYRGLICSGTSAVSGELPAVTKNFFPQTLSLVPLFVQMWQL